MLKDGKLEDREVEVEVSQQNFPLFEYMQPPPGMEGADVNFMEMLQEMLPKRKKRRQVRLPEARRILIDEELRKLAAAGGLSGSVAELCRHEGVRRRVQQIIEERSTGLARFEQIKTFTILPEDFTQATGELTPTMKIKRKAIVEKYRAEIDAMYAAAAAARTGQAGQ